jgi:hypothetical protein
MVSEQEFCRRGYDLIKGLRMGSGFLDNDVVKESGVWTGLDGATWQV